MTPSHAWLYNGMVRRWVYHIQQFLRVSSSTNRCNHGKFLCESRRKPLLKQLALISWLPQGTPLTYVHFKHSSTKLAKKMHGQQLCCTMVHLGQNDSLYETFPLQITIYIYKLAWFHLIWVCSSSHFLCENHRKITIISVVSQFTLW